MPLVLSYKRVLKVISPAIVLVVLVGVLAYAGVLVRYPMTGKAVWVKPDIVFQAGSNANQTGLYGVTLDTYITDNSTNVTFTLTLTYQHVEVRDLFRISNVNNTVTYYIGFYYDPTANPLPSSVTTAQLVLVDANGNPVVVYDLLTGGWSGWIQLPASTTYEVWFIFETQGDTKLPTQVTIPIQLWWSPSNTETP